MFVSTLSGINVVVSTNIDIRMIKKQMKGALIPPTWNNRLPKTGPRLKPIPDDVSMHAIMKFVCFGYIYVRIAILGVAIILSPNPWNALSIMNSDINKVGLLTLLTTI